MISSCRSSCTGVSLSSPRCLQGHRLCCSKLSPSTSSTSELVRNADSQGSPFPGPARSEFLGGNRSICFNKLSWRFSNTFKPEDPLAWENCLTTSVSLSILSDDQEKLKGKNFEDSDQCLHLLHIKISCEFLKITSVWSPPAEMWI